MPERPLFVTRKFPPSVGGMETLSAEVWSALRDLAPSARLVAHGGRNHTLPLWLPAALIRAATLVIRRRVDVVLAGDALVYAALRPMLWLLRVPSATMVHGLDITYNNRLYQLITRPPLLRAPRVIANSLATALVAKEAGVQPERVGVIWPGIEAPEVSRTDRLRAGEQLRARYGLPADSVVLLTLGRLVQRKGARWFVQNVLPGLPEQVHYLVAGTGPEHEPIAAAAAAAGLADRVRLLGAVTPVDREVLLAGSDLFVQPNIRVVGDMEGFGLVVVEAALRGTPVIASGIEGILDAIENQATGILLPPGAQAVWLEQMRGLVADRAALADMGAAFQPRVAERHSPTRLRTRLAEELGLPLDAANSADRP